MRVLRLLYIGVAGGIVAFAGVGAVLKGQLASVGWEAYAPHMVGAVVVLAILAFGAYTLVQSVVLSRAARAAARFQYADEVESAALGAYRQVALVRAVLVDVPSFAGVAVYMLTSSIAALGVGLCGVAVLLWSLPSEAGLQRTVARLREWS